jgi:hypothetical protein
MEVVDERAYLASIDPVAGDLLIGVIDPGSDDQTSQPNDQPGEPEMYVLSKITRPRGRTLSMTSSASMVALAWLEQDRQYRVALHQVGDSPDRWQISPPIQADTDYRGSEHFDLAIDTTGRLRLMFHDAATRALVGLTSGRLTSDSPTQTVDDTPWSASVIDDPADQADTSVCSEQQRLLSGQGLGLYPDTAVRGGAIFVAYHDADCGDLRLASRLDEQWVVTVIDTGDFEREDDLSLRRGVTGKYASIALDSAGNVAIAYQDSSRGQLLIAHDRQGQFSTELADAGFVVDAVSRKRKHMVGGFASLSFDDDDIAWVAYLNQTTSRLRLAKRTRELDSDGDWVQQTIDAPGPTGYSASLVDVADWGLFVAAEHLQARPGGLASSLQFFGEEAF